MKKLLHYRKINHLIEQINIEKVYPLSIVEGYQSGEVFVDDIDNPMMALFWHYCGFAFVAGVCNEEIYNDIYRMIRNPAQIHSNRLVMQAEKDNAFDGFHDLVRRERYIFSFAHPSNRFSVPIGCRLCPITGDNYGLLQGRIIPSFSWENQERFLKNGFGFCLMKENEVLACAFSAAVSNQYVDIGIETNERYRGKGYGKIVASVMVEEIMNQQKIPVWACDTQNEGSMRLACALGFCVEGIHPWYKL